MARCSWPAGLPELQSRMVPARSRPEPPERGSKQSRAVPYPDELISTSCHPIDDPMTRTPTTTSRPGRRLCTDAFRHLCLIVSSVLGVLRWPRRGAFPAWPATAKYTDFSRSCVRPFVTDAHGAPGRNRTADVSKRPGLGCLSVTSPSSLPLYDVVYQY